MILTIISILRMAAAGALLPLAALACVALTPTIAPTATPPCEVDEPGCSPHPLDLLALAAVYQSVK